MHLIIFSALLAGKGWKAGLKQLVFQNFLSSLAPISLWNLVKREAERGAVKKRNNALSFVWLAESLSEESSKLLWAACLALMFLAHHTLQALGSKLAKNQCRKKNVIFIHWLSLDVPWAHTLPSLKQLWSETCGHISFINAKKDNSVIFQKSTAIFFAVATCPFDQKLLLLSA